MIALQSGTKSPLEVLSGPSATVLAAIIAGSLAYVFGRRQAEHQVRFSRLHEKRAEIIAEMYQLLVDFELALRMWLAAPISPKPGENGGSHRDFQQYFRKKRLGQEGRNHLLMIAGERCFSGTIQVSVMEQDINRLGNAEHVDRFEVEQELKTILNRLAQHPRLVEGLHRHTTQTSARPRSAAFAIAVKRLYGYRCAVCESELRAPDGKPEVQSAHIYPKRLDGRDDVRNGICLCRRHHWALDAGWLAITDNHEIMVREELPDRGEYEFIRECEGERIRLPSVAEAAPVAMFLREHRKLVGFV